MLSHFISLSNISHTILAQSAMAYYLEAEEAHAIIRGALFFSGSGSTACAQGGWLIAGSTYQRELSQKAFFPLISLFHPLRFLLSASLGCGRKREKITPDCCTGCCFSSRRKPAAANSQGDFALQLLVNSQHKQCSAKTKCTHEALPPVVVYDSALMYHEPKYLKTVRKSVCLPFLFA